MVPSERYAHVTSAAGQRNLLRARRYELAVARRAARRAARPRRELQGRLQALHEKMLTVGEPLYASRIAAVQQELQLLDEQARLDDRLLAEQQREHALRLSANEEVERLLRG